MGGASHVGHGNRSLERQTLLNREIPFVIYHRLDVVRSGADRRCSKRIRIHWPRSFPTLELRRTPALRLVSPIWRRYYLRRGDITAVAARKCSIACPNYQVSTLQWPPGHPEPRRNPAVGDEKPAGNVCVGSGNPLPLCGRSQEGCNRLCRQVDLAIVRSGHRFSKLGIKRTAGAADERFGEPMVPSNAELHGELRADFPGV